VNKPLNTKDSKVLVRFHGLTHEQGIPAYR
jgi:hypothetical protein